MQFGFEVRAAKSKRPMDEDTAPRQVSMQPRSNKLPRNPGPEEKKVRRGLSRQAEMDGAYFLVDASGGTIPGTSGYATYSDAEADLAAHNAAAVQWKNTGEQSINSHQADPFPPVMNPTVGGKHVSSFNQREAALLDALASPTMSLANKRLLAQELEDVRAARRQARTAAADTDLADTTVRQRMTPVRTHELHTTATDWIAEGDAAEEEPIESPVMAMRTAASLWFGRTSSAVKADADEYTEQAKGMARHLAGQYGIYGPEAREAFVSYARHLNRANLVRTAAEVVHIRGASGARCGATTGTMTTGEHPKSPEVTCQKCLKLAPNYNKHKSNLVRTADDAAFEQADVEPDTQFGWGTEVDQEPQPWGEPDTSEPSQQALQGFEQENESQGYDAPDENIPEGDYDNDGDDDEDETKEARRRRAFRRHAASDFSIVSNSGAVVVGGFDSREAAQSALARLIASGQHNTGEGLHVEEGDSEANDDLDKGDAANESNGGTTARRKVADSSPGSQSGDAVSGLPLTPSEDSQSEPNWDITQWPDTGAAEIPSTRAPVIQENMQENPEGVTNDNDAVLDNDTPRTEARRRAAKVISYKGRKYVLASDEDDKERSDRLSAPRGSEESHDQSGDAESTLPDVQVGGPNDQTPWPWELPENVDRDYPQPSGAADEADVPAPGIENPEPGWPQPEDDDRKKQSAFRRRVNARRSTPGL